jgi:hypothetical protein
MKWLTAIGLGALLAFLLPMMLGDRLPDVLQLA